MAKGQMRLLGIILSLHARRVPITFRKLAAKYGCNVYSIQGMMQNLRDAELVDWESGGPVVAATIRPCVRLIPAEDL